MAHRSRPRGKRPSAEHQRAGAITGYQVLALNAFAQVRDTELQDYVATMLGYSDQQRQALKSRWSKWLTNLPATGGRVTVEEIPHIKECIKKEHILPTVVLENLSDIFPGLLFHAIASELQMKQSNVVEMREKMLGEYNVFRYSASEHGKIAVGTLKIMYNSRCGSIDTAEQYKTGKENYEIRGHLFRLSDGTHRIFGVHSYGRPQVINIKHVDWYTNGDSPDLNGCARRLGGFFFDRSRMGLFYAGMIGMQRIDSDHPRRKVGVITADKLKSIDAQIFKELEFDAKLLSKNLVEFGK